MLLVNVDNKCTIQIGKDGENILTGWTSHYDELFVVENISINSLFLALKSQISSISDTTTATECNKVYIQDMSHFLID
jgi:hypothetical protein